MSSFHDPIVRRELPFIAQIIRDETWLEAERRGCPVPPDDPVVRHRVSEVVLRIGDELRQRLTREYQAAAAQDAA